MSGVQSDVRHAPNRTFKVHLRTRFAPFQSARKTMNAPPSSRQRQRHCPAVWSGRVGPVTSRHSSLSNGSRMKPVKFKLASETGARSATRPDRGTPTIPPQAATQAGKASTILLFKTRSTMTTARVTLRRQFERQIPRQHCRSMMPAHPEQIEIRSDHQARDRRERRTPRPPAPAKRSGRCTAP